MYERLEHCEEWVHRFRRRFPPPPVAMRSGYRETSMALDGYGASIMLAPRLRGKKTHGLPQGIPTLAYPVAPYDGCPRGWRRTRDAFFVPIPLGKDGKGPGMWYNWTMNDDHTHDIAVVPSTTGLNPIVGRKADKLRLEQYKERCPVHNESFDGDRFCPVRDGDDPCGYQHPPQNYVAPPNTRWWDGFRRADGTVEQFWFSDQVLERDVGVAVLGADRVPAFGFAFFRSTQPKPQPVHRVRRSEELLDCGGPMGGWSSSPSLPVGPDVSLAKGRPAAACRRVGRVTLHSAADDIEEIASREERDGSEDVVAACALVDSGEETLPPIAAVGAAPTSEPTDDREVAGPPPVGASVGEIRAAAIERAVAVGRGARINQDLAPDPRSLSEWQDEPAAVLTVYFVPEEVAVAILQGPKRDLVGDPAGYLKDVRVPAGAD